MKSYLATYWIGHAWSHIKAADSGIRNVSNIPEHCPFLVVEDFATIGLEGDPTAADRDESNQRNHFYAFFRAEGVSVNTGGRGTWGVGKTVFPRASRINTLFGLTIRRNDGRRLLMGQSILRYHTVSGTKYAPDGLYGIARHDDFVLPVEDNTLIDRFCNDFKIQRKKEPGLSVVVPYCEEEITAIAITQAIGRDYFVPILSGKLVVEVCDGSVARANTMTLDSITLLNSVVSDECDLDGDLRSIVRFASESLTLPPNRVVQLNDPPRGQAPAWSKSVFPNDEFMVLASRFARGEQIAMRVPFLVTDSNGDEASSHFDIYLQQDLTGNGYRPTFIRNGIIIPQRERRLRGYRLFALVIIDDKPLAKMLADAESPAHDEWNHRLENFRGKYKYPNASLDFVRTSPREIAELLSGARQEKDRLTLADFFPRPPQDVGLDTSQDSESEQDNDDDNKEQTVPMLPPPKPRAYEIKKLRGGFRVRRACVDVARPAKLEIAVAYDRSRGEPLTKYHDADFTLAKMRIVTTGVSDPIFVANRLYVEVMAENFEIEVTGFDENRDLFVRANARGQADD